MNDTDWKCLRTSYGDAVTGFLRSNNVIPERTASGAFKIPDARYLTVCSRLATAKNNEVTQKKKIKRRKNASSPLDNVAMDCYDLPENYKPIINIKEEKIPKPDLKFSLKKFSNHHQSIATNMKICLEDLCRLPINDEKLKFFDSKNLLPHLPWNYENTFERIMETNIGREKITGYENCLERISKILKDFHHNHEKFQYFTFLEVTLKKNSRNKHEPHVSLHQLQKYFSQIFASVIPLSLFGTSANVKKIRAGLKKCFFAPWNAKICLKHFVFTMKISDITWLQSIQNESTRWCVISKITKWLFETYFVMIFTTVFFIMKDLYSEKKIFLSALRWDKVESRYIETQQSKGSVIKKKRSAHENSNSTSVPSAKLFLRPKQNGVRTIYRMRYSESNSDTIAMMKVLMQQMYEQRYNCMTKNELHYEFKRYAEGNEENEKQKVYLASTDVIDAYGSVDQIKLYDIVNGMLNDIPHDELMLEWLATLKPRIKWQKNIIEYKCWFSSCEKPLPLKSRSLVAPIEDEQHQKQLKSKEHIRTLFKAYILEQTFQGKKYVLKKGIAQGSRLSAVLSEIYYSHMTLEVFGRFMKSGTLARFVDDFLYMTHDEELAKEFEIHWFLKIIKTGIPEYQCRFKALKTQTTVKSKYFKPSTSVTFLGFKIDSTSMDVTPSYKPLEFQYVKTMQQIHYKDDIESFFYRLNNFACLKLAKLVLDARINSQEAILTTAKLSAHTMASRCVILIENVFDRMEQHVSLIWENIRDSVKRLVRIFSRHLFPYKGKKRTDMIIKIQITIWKSILRVFSRNIKLRFHFCHDIKRMIKNGMAL